MAESGRRRDRGPNKQFQFIFVTYEGSIRYRKLTDDRNRDILPNLWSISKVSSDDTRDPVVYICNVARPTVLPALCPSECTLCHRSDNIQRCPLLGFMPAMTYS